MRIKSIQLSWFRGAADPVALEPNSKSMVVYGENGSGKSCFVDAVEYVLNDGKIGHLGHEYSGKHQEKAVPNTHKPKGRKTQFKIKFKDNSEFETEIKPTRSSTSSGAEPVAMGTWDYRRTVLRQDARSPSSSTTPREASTRPCCRCSGCTRWKSRPRTFGSSPRASRSGPKLKETKAALRGVKTKREATFGTDGDDQILKKIEGFHGEYCADKAATKDALARCEEVETALDARIARFSADQRRHLVLQDAAEIDLKAHVNAVRAASVTLAGAANDNDLILF